MIAASAVEVLSNLDDYGLWLAAVVAGLTAMGWLLKRGFLAVRTFVHRTADIFRKIDTLDELAGYELNSNGGGSIKDRVSVIPTLTNKVHTLEQSLSEHISKCPPPAQATSVVVTSEGTTVKTEVPS